MQNEIEAMKRFQEGRLSAGSNSKPIAGRNSEPTAEPKVFLGCGPADPDDDVQEEDVHFQDADSQHDDQDAQNEMMRMLKASQPFAAAEEEPKRAAAAESSSEMEDLKKMVKELAITVASLAARSATPSEAGSNPTRKADPAGSTSEDRTRPEFFNMCSDDGKKTDTKEDQTTSENSKLEMML